MPGNERAAAPEKRKEPAAVQRRAGSHTKCSTPKDTKRRGRVQAPRPGRRLYVGLKFTQRTRDGLSVSYAVVGVESYTRRRDGRPINLHVLKGRCAACGAPFRLTAGQREPKYLTRHCERHRGPGNGHG
jgi:hypothetical protein